MEIVARHGPGGLLQACYALPRADARFLGARSAVIHSLRSESLASRPCTPLQEADDHKQKHQGDKLRAVQRRQRRAQQIPLAAAREIITEESVGGKKRTVVAAEGEAEQ